MFNPLELIKSIYFNDKFRAFLFKLLFPINASKFYWVSYLQFKNEITQWMVIRTTIIVFLLQVIFFVPAILYSFYYKYLVFPKIIRNKKKFNGEIRKIGIYSPSFDIYAGGGEKVTAHIAQLFERKFQNADIEIICDDYRGYRIKVPASNDEANAKYGTNLIRTKSNYYNNKYISFFFLQYEKLFLRKTAEFDIFVNCFMNLLPAFGGINIHYVHFPYTSVDSKSNILFEMYLKSYDIFLTNSKYTDKWTKILLNVENTKVIYPPVIIPEVKEVPEKSNVILSVGRFDPAKKFECQIETFQNNLELLDDYELHIVGSLRNKDIDYFNKLKSLVTTNKTKFYPNLTYIELQNKYKDSKIYWHSMGYGMDENKHPGVYEHFGITVIEAMSWGCVPVVINNGGPAEVVNDGECGLVWNNLDELISQTTKLISDDSLRKKLALKSISAVSKYKHENFESDFEKIIDELIKGRK